MPSPLRGASLPALLVLPMLAGLVAPVAADEYAIATSVPPMDRRIDTRLGLLVGGADIGDARRDSPVGLQFWVEAGAAMERVS